MIVLCRLVLVNGWSRGFPSPRRKVGRQRPEQLELAAGRHRHPAPLQVPHARMAVAIISSTRASRPYSDGSFARAARSRTPAGMSGPSPQRLVTQFVIVLARRCPGVSHSSVRYRLPPRRRSAPACGAWGRGQLPHGRLPRETRRQFDPQAAGDAEQGLDDQVRKVVDDVNRSTPGHVPGLEVGTVAVAAACGLRP